MSWHLVAKLKAHFSNTAFSTKNTQKWKISMGDPYFCQKSLFSFY
uniref:Uncharacterized protein n=1 Tax=Arundo donax TaxID=35708 RepID=A0A0A8XYG2_ARUDO